MSLLLSILVSVASSPQNTELVVTCGTNYTDCLSNSLIEPSCGYYNKDKVISTPFGIETSEIPWHAGVYDKEARIINTGTLISKRVVVTAAEVYYYENKAQLPVSRYAVAVGNIDCDMERMRDYDSQILDVDRIIFHPKYTGESTQYRHNLALVVAAKDFSYTDNVRPACLSFDPNFDAQMLREAADSKVDLLSWDTCHRAISAKYISTDECKTKLRSIADSNIYLNEDTFCAEGFGKGSQCTAGSGAGIIFPARVGGTERYFLRGISAEVSIKAEGTVRVFTHVLHYEHFIKSVLDLKETHTIQHSNLNTVLNVTVEVK